MRFRGYCLSVPVFAVLTCARCIAGLAEATDYNGPWSSSSTNGSLDWVDQSIASLDGVDAARGRSSAPPTAGSWIETKVTGPTTLYFSYLGHFTDPRAFQLTIGGTSIALGGTLDTERDVAEWRETSAEIPAGVQTIRWEMSSPTVISAYIDQIWTSADARPRITETTNNTFQLGVHSAWHVPLASKTPATLAATGLPPGLALNAATNVISGTPTERGNYLARLSATNNAGTHVAHVRFRVSTTTLAEAMDAEGSVFEYGSETDWVGLTGIGHDGVDCARGIWGGSGLNRLTTIFVGPGNLRFWYRTEGDQPMFWSHPGSPSESLSATTWTRVTKRLPAGPQPVYWYAPYIGPAGIGYNLGYLDEVTFFPDPPEIAVDVEPSLAPVSDGGRQGFGNVVITAASSRTFNIRNTGTVNLTGLGITIEGVNAAHFSVTSNPTAPVNGPNGSTTFTVQFSPASPGVKTAALRIANNDADENPFDIILTGTGLIAAQPTNQVVSRGGAASFSVPANGAASFQWSKDGVDIPGATESSLVIASAQPWHIVNYIVRVTNAAGSRVSDPVSLRLTDVSSGIWRGLVACYPFDGSAEDLCRPGKPAGFVNTSGLVTDPQRGGVAHIQGKGWAIPAFPGESAELQGPGGYLQIPRPPLVYGEPFTVSFVIKEEGFSLWHGESLFTMGEGASSNDLLTHFWVGSMQGAQEIYAGPTQTLQPYASDYVLDDALGAAITVASPWTAYTAVGDGNILRLYRNGQPMGTSPYKKETLGDSFIGRHWWENGSRFSTRLIAKVDDLRVYNRALSPQEVTLLYSSAQFTVIPNSFEAWVARYGLSAGDADLSADPEGDGLSNREEYCFGTSPVTESGPLMDTIVEGSTLKLRWFGRDGVLYSVKESLDLIPPWIGGLRVPSRALDQRDVPAGYERMEVDIPLPPPTAPPDRRRFVRIEATIGPLIEDGGNVVTQPPSRETVPGQPANFTVVAAGEGLTYQWYKDDQPIPGQTSAVYAIAAAKTNDVGYYSVMVTNAAGSVTSRKVFFLVTE